MAAVIRLDEHDLILMREVERPLLVLLDRHMERRLSTLDNWDQIRVVSVIRSDELSAPEPVLRVAASRKEDGAVVD